MTKSKCRSCKTLSNFCSYTRVVAFVCWNCNNFRKPFIIKYTLQYSNDNFSCFLKNDFVSVSSSWSNCWKLSGPPFSQSINSFCIYIVESNPYCMHSSKSSVLIYSCVASQNTSSYFSAWFIAWWVSWEKVANSGFSNS